MNVLFHLEVVGIAAVAGDEVFVIDRELGETDFLRCLDRDTGEEKWRFAQTRLHFLS